MGDRRGRDWINSGMGDRREVEYLESRKHLRVLFKQEFLT